MKKINITYWVFTGLLSVLMLFGSIPDINSDPEAVALFNHLGYPAYLLPFLGIAKLLGVVAILIPGFSRIKEWAYAGLTFDLTGAMYSTILVDGLTSDLIVFVIGYTVIAGSYVLYHKKLKDVLLNHTKKNDTGEVLEHKVN
ncbi:DoxX family protein [Anaerobacillus sp. 1_MG-2023]|uniref:DoxX family protein n=1 Tax=Anaerobacillus sp. 1_MG-2023 TaxID=3062655 RepID=UPI0026E17DEF|nr:DoxX family protein [Anaerobacillus sp. 1_MG-2023]MDO6655484.1 DoxX family protein [Anaerobacillus sp. 1_MG-2023]